ncbi:MAG: hypothetical protein GY861_09705, partial [bacterium]|nr:hypothetical protein [bacterium]
YFSTSREKRKEAKHAAFLAKFFQEWQERQKHEEVQGLSADGIKHRIVDPTEQKLYWKIPLITEEDRRQFKEGNNLSTP